MAATPRSADEKLSVLRLRADRGVGSSCSLIHDLTLSEAVTDAAPITTNAVPQATSVVPRITNAIVQDNTAAPNFFCQGHPAENCADGVDDDGDGLVDCDGQDCQGDADGDSYVAAPCGTDCDDADPAVNPGAAELCDNAKHDECDGRTDCDGSECISLPTCTLSTTYRQRRSVVKFNLRSSGRDRAVVRICVTQGLCDALAAMAEDGARTLRVTFDPCPDVVVTGEVVMANAAATVFKAKSPADQLPAYSIKVSCRKLKAVVKLREADLQACVANPVAATLAAGGARPLQAEAQFTEVQDGDGNLRSLVLFSSDVCTD